MTRFTSVLVRTVLYVDSHGAGSPQGNCLDSRCVSIAKGDDLKQIVKLPALNLSVSAGLTATQNSNIHDCYLENNSLRLDFFPLGQTLFLLTIVGRTNNGLGYINLRKRS